MNSELDPIPAPQDALGWSPEDGFIYDRKVLTDRLAQGWYVHMISDDGRLYGVMAQDRAPLAAVLRLEGDVASLVEALGDFGEYVAERLAKARS